MSKKFIKSLSTLIKVEKGHIADLQPRLSELNQMLLEIDQKIESLKASVEREKNFMKTEVMSIDFISFFSRIELEKKNLNDKRDEILIEYDALHELMMDHVKSEKSYKIISDRLTEEEKFNLEKQETEIIDDIIQMRNLTQIELLKK
jgi:hypothetical protein